MRHSGFAYEHAHPARTPPRPKRRPPRPQHPIFSVFHQSGLRFGRHTASSRGLAVANRGNCTTRASDTPTTRRQKASCSAKPPRPPVRRAPEDPEGRGARLRCPWAAAGLGRASRRRAERSSRRGRLAGGPPPTGAQSSPAETTVRGALHPLRAAAPVTGRYTRSEGVHCLRIGCSASSHKNKRGICETTADTHRAPGARAPGALSIQRSPASIQQSAIRRHQSPISSQQPLHNHQSTISRHSTSRRRGHPRR